MVRPKITEFFPELSDNHKLYNHVVSLNNYIDQLENGFKSILNAPIPYNEKDLQSWIENARKVAQSSQGVSV